MTEEGYEEQMFRFDQTNIEHGEGFIKWKKQEIDRMEKYYHEERASVLKRVDRLEAWAIENDMMKPIEDRKTKSIPKNDTESIGSV